MPEGPSIVILRELIENLHLEGSPVIAVSGKTSIDQQRILNKKVIAFKSWGKHFLICFEGFTLRIHLMMFGDYRINERKEGVPTLRLVFETTELNFYTCSLIILEGELSEYYNWATDVLSDEWDPAVAIGQLKTKETAWVCDVLLDQALFSGVGNIIKNEVLYRIGIQPMSTVGALSTVQLKLLAQEARQYSFDFLKWKKENTLKKYWLIYTKKLCPLKHPVEKIYLGKNKRISYFCPICQQRYTDHAQKQTSMELPATKKAI